jgi:uncharacterized lipoprotein
MSTRSLSTVFSALAIAALAACSSMRDGSGSQKAGTARRRPTSTPP